MSLFFFVMFWGAILCNIAFMLTAQLGIEKYACADYSSVARWFVTDAQQLCVFVYPDVWHSLSILQQDHGRVDRDLQTLITTHKSILIRDYVHDESGETALRQFLCRNWYRSTPSLASWYGTSQNAGPIRNHTVLSLSLGRRSSDILETLNDRTFTFKIKMGSYQRRTSPSHIKWSPCIVKKRDCLKTKRAKVTLNKNRLNFNFRDSRVLEDFFGRPSQGRSISRFRVKATVVYKNAAFVLIQRINWTP